MSHAYVYSLFTWSAAADTVPIRADAASEMNDVMAELGRPDDFLPSYNHSRYGPGYVPSMFTAFPRMSVLN